MESPIFPITKRPPPILDTPLMQLAFHAIKRHAIEVITQRDAVVSDVEYFS